MNSDETTTHAPYTGKYLNSPQLAEILTGKRSDKNVATGWANALKQIKASDLDYEALGLEPFSAESFAPKDGYLNFQDKGGGWAIPECFAPFIQEAMTLTKGRVAHSKVNALRQVLGVAGAEASEDAPGQTRLQLDELVEQRVAEVIEKALGGFEAVVAGTVREAVGDLKAALGDVRGDTARAERASSQLQQDVEQYVHVVGVLQDAAGEVGREAETARALNREQRELIGAFRTELTKAQNKTIEVDRAVKTFHGSLRSVPWILAQGIWQLLWAILIGVAGTLFVINSDSYGWLFWLGLVLILVGPILLTFMLMLLWWQLEAWLFRK